MKDTDIIFPAPLKRGDKIAICSPAGRIKENIVNDAAQVLRAQGYRVEIMPHALGQSGNFSGTPDERYADIKAAFADPETRAILCSRGGYGVVHIMDRLAALPLEKDPKWVIGFSDISALHALMATKGIASIHSSMCAHIKKGAADPDNRDLFAILRGERPVHIFDSHDYDRQGLGTGILRGGNLAVLAELINTPYDVFQPDTILFLEDVAEPIYKIERIFYQLRLSGVLARIKGLMVGQFTEYKADDNYKDMETMIRDAVAGYSFPVAYNVPVGHVDHNIPLIESAKVTLKVSPSGRNSIIFHR
ncbi:MAG: LD-carboxypeptidase [Muribaculaceae bacterium]|nr:LD-carboxypeptidase [Muribaculaceae bacterium]